MWCVGFNSSDSVWCYIMWCVGFHSANRICDQIFLIDCLMQCNYLLSMNATCFTSVNVHSIKVASMFFREIMLIYF